MQKLVQRMNWETNGHRVVNCLLTILIVSLLALTVLAATSKITKESVVSKEKQRTYYLFVPETIKAPAPLIVLLHGSTRSGESLVVKWKELAEGEGIIIAGPDSADSANWTAPQRWSGVSIRPRRSP